MSHGTHTTRCSCCICVLILLYMCVFVLLYVSSYYCIYVSSFIGRRQGLHVSRMCLHSTTYLTSFILTIYVSSFIGRRQGLHVSRMCPHSTTYLSSFIPTIYMCPHPYCTRVVCVLILHMCPHTALCVLIHTAIRVSSFIIHTPIYGSSFILHTTVCMCPHSYYIPVVCILILLYVCPHFHTAYSYIWVPIHATY
jgi:uncharacterized membrane protein YfhO